MESLDELFIEEQRTALIDLFGVSNPTRDDAIKHIQEAFDAIINGHEAYAYLKNQDQEDIASYIPTFKLKKRFDKGESVDEAIERYEESGSALPLDCLKGILNGFDEMKRESNQDLQYLSSRDFLIGLYSIVEQGMDEFIKLYTHYDATAEDSSLINVDKTKRNSEMCMLVKEIRPDKTGKTPNQTEAKEMYSAIMRGFLAYAFQPIIDLAASYKQYKESSQQVI